MYHLQLLHPFLLPTSSKSSNDTDSTFSIGFKFILSFPMTLSTTHASSRVTQIISKICEASLACDFVFLQSTIHILMRVHYLRCNTDLLVSCFSLSMTSSCQQDQIKHLRRDYVVSPLVTGPLLCLHFFHSLRHALHPSNIAGCYYPLLHPDNTLTFFISGCCFSFISC